MPAPFQRTRLAPFAGRASEVKVAGGTWCVELERGAQPGVRLGFESVRDDSLSVPFDTPGCSVLASGQERFWVHWPSTVDQTRSLDLTAWTVPGRYTRLAGNEHALPIVHVLERAEASDAGAGFTIFGPWSVNPYDVLGNGSHLRLSRGARLIVEAGASVGVAGSFDASIEERILVAGAFRFTDGKRGVGVPSKPAGELIASFDRPVPLGDFRVRIGYSAAATFWHSTYLLLGP